MPRVFVLLGTIGFSIGVVLGEYLQTLWPLIAAIVVSLVFWSWTRRGLRLVVLVTMVLIGSARIHQSITSLDESTAGLVANDASLSGLVTRVSENSGRQTIEVMNLDRAGLPSTGGGRIHPTDIRQVEPGDLLIVDCRWIAPDPDKRRRGQSQGVLVECWNPAKIQNLGMGRDWRARLARARGQLVARIGRQYHHPQSDLLAGILLGFQDSMSAELRQDFRATGTSHIVALSGFNVTIIITILASTLTSMIGRRLAVWPTLALIIGFVIMTGASASVTRAAVMTAIVMAAQLAGRPAAPSRILAYTALTMVAVNPFLLRYDLGFQLSFLATFGLIYLASAISTRLVKIPEMASLRGNLASTLAAMIATEPLLLWTFGRFSIVAPVVNIAVLPFIPLIMATGAVALIFPLAVPITDALLRLVLWVITTAGSWSLAQVMTPWWVAGGLAGLAAMLILRIIYVTHDQDTPQR